MFLKDMPCTRKHWEIESNTIDYIPCVIDSLFISCYETSIDEAWLHNSSVLIQMIPPLSFQKSAVAKPSQGTFLPRDMLFNLMHAFHLQAPETLAVVFGKQNKALLDLSLKTKPY